MRDGEGVAPTDRLEDVDEEGVLDGVVDNDAVVVVVEDDVSVGVAVMEGCAGGGAARYG